MRFIDTNSYVIEQTSIYVDGCSGHIPSAQHKYIKRTTCYAKFMELDLTLGMLIACDENGKILTEPKIKGFAVSKEYHDKKVEEFIQAEEKVIFKGFESIDTRHDERIHITLGRKFSSLGYNVLSIENDEFGLVFYDHSMRKQRLNKVKDLLLYEPLEIRDLAVRQYGFE